jgi:hypothetical protein
MLHAAPSRVRAIESRAALATAGEEDAAGPLPLEVRRPKLDEPGGFGRRRLHDQPSPDRTRAHVLEKRVMLTACNGIASPAELDSPFHGACPDLTGFAATAPPYPDAGRLGEDPAHRSAVAAHLAAPQVQASRAVSQNGNPNTSRIGRSLQASLLDRTLPECGVGQTGTVSTERP